MNRLSICVFFASLVAAASPAQERGLRVMYSSTAAAEASRVLASFSEPQASIFYATFPEGRTPLVEELTSTRWRDKISAADRFDFLLKFHYANSRSESRSGLRHAACFEGDPGSLARIFFARDLLIENLIDDVIATPSSDGLLLGLQFRVRNPADEQTRNLHFRLPNCTSAGKEFILNEAQLGRSPRRPQSVKAEAAPMRLPANTSAEQEGFLIHDQARGVEGLPRFSLKADYERAVPAADDRRWQDMDAGSEAGARKLAELLLAHSLEGLANQSRNPNANFDLTKSRRYWCHMPWMNQGDSQRDAIHGLTKERDLAPSKIYPNATEGSDWGLAYYNAAGCRTLGQIFGSPAAGILNPPRWEHGRFSDGTLAAKLLFTTADFPALAGAFTWQANLSGPKQAHRSLRPARLLQIDISLKDSSVKGSQSNANHWLMFTYYYDLNYQAPAESPLRQISNLPAPFLKMRPAGIQRGFAKGDSLIFAGAHTNQGEGLLNGPAANPKSSCLSCHAVAGSSLAMVPGVMSAETFLRKVLPEKHLDFSQQLALARRNYETRLRRW